MKKLILFSLMACMFVNRLSFAQSEEHQRSADSVQDLAPPGAHSAEQVQPIAAKLDTVVIAVQAEYSIVEEIDRLTHQAQSLDSVLAYERSLVPYAKEISQKARKYRVPPELLAALIQEESRFDIWATRTEPHYKLNKVVQREARAHSKRFNGIPTVQTEIDDRSRSYGLMQPMGQVAREQGFNNQFLAELYLPENSIEQGAKLLRKKFDRYGTDTLAVISSYNQGTARKQGGTFTNARYVYRVSVALRAYAPHFPQPAIKKSNGIQPSTQTIDRTGMAHRSRSDRDSLLSTATERMRIAKTAYRTPTRHDSNDSGHTAIASPWFNRQGEPPSSGYRGLYGQDKPRVQTERPYWSTAGAEYLPIILGVFVALGILGFAVTRGQFDGGHDQHQLRPKRGSVHAEVSAGSSH
jgi:hypothetical protein